MALNLEICHLILACNVVLQEVIKIKVEIKTNPIPVWWGKSFMDISGTADVIKVSGI